MTSSDTITEPGVEHARIDSPGKRLRIERQAKGLSIERVATQLHLSQPMVQALEEDDYGRLPGAVFIRGYLRNYARLLGLDPVSIVAAYDQGKPREPDQAPMTAPAAGLPIQRRPWGRWVPGLLLVLALLVLLAYWWQMRLGAPLMTVSPSEEAAGEGPPFVESTPGGELPPPAAAEGPTESALPPPIPVGATLEPSPTPSEATARSAPESAPESTSPAPPPVSTPEPIQAPAQETQATAPEVVMTFTAPCWVDVRDHSGRFKLLGELKAGETRTLGGEPPYRIVLGNTQGVKILVDGKPFDLAAHARGNVARFTLDPGRSD